jgi:hypothetical protein
VSAVSQDVIFYGLEEEGVVYALWEMLWIASFFAKNNMAPSLLNPTQDKC